jgi:phosphatidylethanolamine/phosphatidyl-N-methylethanolamine N-methyltransferase
MRSQIQSDIVARLYDRLASVYDLIFGPALQLGRRRAVQRMQIEPGDRILEVGVGTGLNLGLYPRDCHVTGIDLTGAVLEKARGRSERYGLDHVDLLRMDARHLGFPDDTFDVVYAAYLVSVVSDPIGVVREMRRVCKPGGSLVILNHFRSSNALLARLEHAVCDFTIRHAGFKSDMDLDAFLAQAELTPESIEKVNVPRIWSLVTCPNPA